jgi:hypothetical protein
MTQNERIVFEFLKTLESRKSAEELERFYHPDVVQIEYPNAVTKHTTIRDIDELKAGADKGQKLFSKEDYEIKKLYSFENTVILEAIWTGTLAISIGNISTGDQVVAYFAQFLEFKEGKIYRQRNYDCFEPFS